MPGYINRKMALTNILNDIPNLIEVYSEPSFSFFDEKANFHFLSNDDIETPELFKKLQHWYPLGVNIYIAHSDRDIALNSLKIIWRRGRWYL